jgi:hypothetical protein
MQQKFLWSEEAFIKHSSEVQKFLLKYWYKVTLKLMNI